MEFKNKVQKDCYQKIAGWMKELFGEEVMVPDDSSQVWVRSGSAMVTVAVFPWGDDDATVCCRSYLVSGADVTLDLARFLLEKNSSMMFGAFGIDDDGDIIFDHTILGPTCDKEELRASVRAVAGIADEYDDIIRSRWGGERAVDKFKED